MADRMALAMFGSLYLLFHVVFVARICASTDSRRTKPNIFIPSLEHEGTVRAKFKESFQAVQRIIQEQQNLGAVQATN